MVQLVINAKRYKKQGGGQGVRESTAKEILPEKLTSA